MKLPLQIETAAEYYCRKILSRIQEEVINKSEVKTEIPKIKQYLS